MTDLLKLYEKWKASGKSEYQLAAEAYFLGFDEAARKALEVLRDEKNE